MHILQQLSAHFHPYIAKVDKMLGTFFFGFSALILTNITMRPFIHIMYPFPFNSWSLSAKYALTIISPQETGHLLFRENAFQGSIKWACLLSRCQDFWWPKATKNWSVFTLGKFQLTEPTRQRLKTEKWSKELIVPKDHTTSCLNQDWWKE